MALAGVTLAVSPGEHVCVLGGNGSGKSTLARLCNGSIVPSRGSVTVEGIDTGGGGRSRDEAAHLVGFVRQDPTDQLVSSSVFDEVAFGPMNLGLAEGEVRGRVAGALGACGLAGYERRGVGELSGGELQRLAIAGVLAMEPAYLVLDEACAHLDGPSRAAVRSLLGDAAAAGRGIVEVTHDVDDILHADRVVVLEAGEVTWSGTPQALLCSDEAISASRLPSDLRLRCYSLLARHGADPAALDGAGPLLREARRLGALDRLRGLLRGDGPTGRAGFPSGESGQGLRLDGVTVDFEECRALDGVSLDVPPGDVMLVAGPSGSGKTTLARVAAALLAPDGGTASASGSPVVPGRVGFSFQRSVDQLFCDTVIDDVSFGPSNLGLGPEKAREAAVGALGRLGVPEGLWGRSPFALSGGQARRVALAGILALDPPALVLDEPTAGLDGSGRRFLHALVRGLAEEGRPVMVVSHDVDEWVEVADEVVLLRGGRVAWRGPVAQAVAGVRPYRAAGIEPPLAASLREALAGG
jgi:energy-coupling factor transport system ATP-binding protein